MPNLVEDLTNFANKFPEDHIKHTFFKKLVALIHANQLTLASLTTNLVALTDEERTALFAPKLSTTSPADSDAAEWIKTLYRAFGAKTDKTMLHALVNGTLTNEQRKKLYNARYEQWRREPFDEIKRRALVHELKGSLGLNKTENKGKALVDILLERWQANRFATLPRDLLILIQQAPEYMPQIIEKLHNASSSEVRKQLKNSLFLAIDKDESGIILAALLNSSPILIVERIKKHPADYFQLDESRKTSVIRLLEQAGDQFIIDKIAIAAQYTAGIKLADFSTALLDGSILQDSTRHQTQLLKRGIAKLAMKQAPELINKDQKNEALKVIQDYLDQNPGSYKQQFFKQLAKDIKKHGISIESLEEQLDATDKKQLFAKWTGLTNSRAAGVMAKLYQIASVDATLTPKEVDDMVNHGLLPPHQYQINTYLQKKIDEVFAAPHQASTSHVTKYLGSIIDDMQEKTQFLVERKHHEQRAAEAIYQKYVIDAGLLLAEQSDNPVFDPQGHVMLFLTLSENDYQAILIKMGKNKNAGSTAKEQVESLLGAKLTQTILCNLDIKKNEALKNKFKEWLGNDKAYRYLMQTEPHESASIIQLQEELTLHILLSLRVLESKIPASQIDSQLRSKLLIEVNKLVQHEVRSALTLACKPGHIDIEYDILNNELDKARKKLSPICREKLVELVQETYPETDWKQKVKALHKHDFTSTTATGLDYIHVDVRNQTVVRISGTEHTAHDKKIGADTQAFRVLYRNHFHSDGTITPYATQTLEARVPSIADRKASSIEGVQDAAEKLALDHQRLKSQAVHCHGPLVYNLLTSLHTVAYDLTPFESSNRQRLSAEYILQGSHRYNLQQMRAGAAKQLVYVQNIPVNQHSNELDDDAFDNATKEATLMTDIAILSTLNHHAGVLPCDLRQHITHTYSSIHKKYLAYLPQTEQGQPYFHKTEIGKEAKFLLNHRKTEWKEAKIASSNAESLENLAIKALFKMFSQNQHRNKQFGMLAQTLSVFIEPMSQAGCKSANERYQGVAGRVEMLKSISSRTNAELSIEERNLREELQNVVNGRGSLAKLQQCMDQAYNLHNLQGSAADFSMEDTGAGSKVKATHNKANPGIITEADTNIAESGFLTRLFQNCCSSMQSHKANLTEVFKGLFSKKEDKKQNSIQP